MDLRTLQPAKPLPLSSQNEAENLVRQAAAAYIERQCPETRERLSEAVQELGLFDPPIATWKGWAPSHRFMLDLMPSELKWPDPLWGDSLFD